MYPKAMLPDIGSDWGHDLALTEYYRTSVVKGNDLRAP